MGEIANYVDTAMTLTAVRLSLEALPDAELAARVALGEPQALELLMRKNNRLLYRTARSILHDDAEAEDCVQEAYLQAYRSIGTFRGESRLSTWLTRIVINLALGRKRKHKKEAGNVSLDNVVSLDGHPLECSDDATQPEQPDAAALRGELRRALERHIDRLPVPFRTVFVLRALEELSVEETAAILGIPEATVRTRFFRARSLLRHAFEQEVDTALQDAFAFDGERCDRIVAAVLDRLRQTPASGPAG